MDAAQYLDALRKRWVSLLVLAVVGALAGFGYASAQPVLYQSTSSVYVAANITTNDAGDQLQGSTLSQDSVQSLVQLAELPAVLNPVIRDLRLRSSSGQAETAGQLATRLDTELKTDSVIISVTASDESPAQAARIANAVTTSLSRQARTLSTSADGTPAITLKSVASAAPASSPSSPRVPIDVLGGLAVGLLIGLAYAFGRQLLDTRIATDDEVRATPGLANVPFLGALSHRRGRARVPNVVMVEPHGVGAEEYRRIVTNLEFAGIDQRIRSVTVTSALSGDGKSTTSINLAAALAERGQRVLLVDADLRRPSIDQYLNLIGGVGMTDLLLGRVKAEQAIQHVGDLDVLPAGTTPPNVTQLVTSASMERLFAELLSRYDMVVVDAPPLLPVVDALTYARLTDGAVVVARQRVTKRRQFAQAVESLALVDAPIVGVVLNDVTRSDLTGYGYSSRAVEARAEEPVLGDDRGSFFARPQGAPRDPAFGPTGDEREPVAAGRPE